MDDRELLELAAKAAGLQGDPLWAGDAGISLWTPQTGTTFWNPLTDDGDALRLAVMLGLSVQRNTHNAIVMHGTEEPILYVHEELGSDPYAATRRAIVRAAAEIGKAMP